MSTFNQSISTRYSYRKRLIRYICLTTVLLAAFSFGVIFQAFAFERQEISTIQALPQTVMVESGDTLWSIAQQFAPAKSDLRVYIDHIKNANHLKTSSLRVGQTIILPGTN